MNAIIAKFESVWTLLVAEEHVLAAELRAAIDKLLHHQASTSASSSGTSAGSVSSSSAPESNAPATTAPAPAPTGPDPVKYANFAEYVMALGTAATDAQIDAWMAVHPGAPDPRTTTAGGEPIVEQPARDLSGRELTGFGDAKRNPNASGAYTVVVPQNGFAGGGFEFKWSEAPGTPNAQVSATVSGAAGSFSSVPGANAKLGSVSVPGAKPGESYAVSLSMSPDGILAVQINPI